MQIEVQSDAEVVTEQVAALIAEQARMAFAACGRFILAVSGGHTPWRMLRMLGKEEVPWSGVHVLQVDDRIAAPGDPDRDLPHLQVTLLEDAPINPVEIADTQSAATDYSNCLKNLQDRFRSSTLCTWVWGRTGTLFALSWRSRFASHGQGGCDHRRLSRP